MDHINLIETFSEFKEFKNIDRETMMRILEDVFRHMLQKRFGSDENFEIIVNIDRGDLEIWRNREIVEDGAVEDENTQIAFSEAIKIEPDFEVGEEVSEELKLEDFGRREILAIRQNLVSKVMEYEKDSIYRKYKEKVGEIITGEVYQVWKKEILILDDEGYELSLPKQEQIPSDFYRKGDTIRAVVSRVEMKNNTPSIVLSRTSPVFLERLFESEVPEIYDGLITIKKIVRVPGERAKVAVESYDDRIDPVGACVGMKGSRINAIIRELRGEKIDIVQWSDDPAQYAANALNPAKISKVLILDQAGKRMEVIVEEKQQSLAIGKKGQNVRLASRLIGWQIDVKSEEQKKQEVLSVMESLTSSSTSLTELEGISDRMIERLREAGIENVERILELGEDKLKEIPGVGDKTAAKIMEAAKDLFEEVEIEVPEGMDLPTAIQAASPEEENSADEAAASESDSETATEASQAEAGSSAKEKTETDEAPESPSKAADPMNSGDDTEH